MSLQNPDNIVTEERLAEFYQQILPYLGGMPDVLANKFNRADLYSTDEKLIGRWIDGKPIYQKVITGLSFIGSSASGSWHYITDSQTDFELNGNVDIVVDATALRTSDSLVFRGCAFRYNKSSSRLEYCSNISFAGCNMLILQYTKTTDSAVEIGDDTDYSATEKIVGTWIDGKPIYEKTVDCGALPNNADKSVAHGITNYQQTINIFGRCYKSDFSGSFILPYPTPVAANAISVLADSTNIVIKTGSNRSMFDKSYVTIQYTKVS